MQIMRNIGNKGRHDACEIKLKCGSKEGSTEVVQKISERKHILKLYDMVAVL